MTLLANDNYDFDRLSKLKSHGNKRVSKRVLRTVGSRKKTLTKQRLLTSRRSSKTTNISNDTICCTVYAPFLSDSIHNDSDSDARRSKHVMQAIVTVDHSAIR
jgi:hypothetical protein